MPKVLKIKFLKYMKILKIKFLKYNIPMLGSRERVELATELFEHYLKTNGTQYRTYEFSRIRPFRFKSQLCSY